MFKLPTRFRKKALKKIEKFSWEKHRVILTASALTIGVITIRSLGLLQTFEWAILDEFFRWRPREAIDERITIVGINETDLQKYGYPISDELLAELLEKLQSFQPRAIGLDIYRDLPREPGNAELVEAFETIPNLIGIELIANENMMGVHPPKVLKEKNRVGFNNILPDDDGKVRRGLLYLTTEDGNNQSFALKLALIYLEGEGIVPKAAPNSRNLQLGEAVFQRFKGNDGGYIRADDEGYQILANLRGPNESFQIVSMEDVLSQKVPPELIRDRLVLIGNTAASIKDFHHTSYSGGLLGRFQKISGVELQANFLSQILSAALQGRNSLKVWSEMGEWLWIFVWSLVGANLGWRLRSPEGSILNMFVVAIAMTGICYLAFIVDGWWLPVFPPILGLFGSGFAILFYRARLHEEFKRSTEFLQSVIDGIPDPIFVKDINHRRIILNQAYCQFIGYPLEELLSKTDSDLFTEEEAKIFWQHDESVFKQNKQQETEEYFTDALGVTHVIASKRSLHKDRAGNLFLVGVIRDITERKQMEEQLKELASELELDNNKLRLLKETLQEQADRDPLTGLPNRKLFRDRLTQSLEWAATNDKLVALLFLDLNGFKLINDTKGHSIGDLLLKGVAERLQGCLRGSDTVSRLGGDEFTVILPGIPNEAVALTVAEKIRDTIDKPFELEGHTIRVTTSIGVSLYPVNAEDIESLIDSADTAMYEDKKKSKKVR
jgi:diguanylate cyclase (GGDEF)-like protein/PAS domain S-box-containing protein